ncbi:MAG: cell surface protein [Bacteroidia bacterium]|nr:cell surface protein [Bacteroidia bacterium]
MTTILIVLNSCSKESAFKTDPTDYAIYLNYSEKEALELSREDYIFWEKKLKKNPQQFPYSVKLAASQSLLFQQTGQIEFLIEAEQNLKKALSMTNYNDAAQLRALARNYISQHRFKEALELLYKAEKNGERLLATQKMLFDVHLELGNEAMAYTYLKEIKDLSDIDYLIRISKWSDYQGNLDAAIDYMEKAVLNAESSNNKGLMQWAYTNIADFYGHDGQIERSYQYYIKALSLDPSDAYAKKGIAWIIYSYERNPEEALRILNTVTNTYAAPDYLLLKAEIAEYMEDDETAKSYLNLYSEAVSNPLYGDMYNAYNIELISEGEDNIESALNLALEEVENRPTPETYDLLAWTLFQLNDHKKALEIIENHVYEKTTEPMALYHMAHIYKANENEQKVNEFKAELEMSLFELGPLTEHPIKAL